MSNDKDAAAARLDLPMCLDSAQLLVQAELETIAEHISHQSIERIQGLYIWGKVGRGKTMLMDNFARQLPAKCVRRQHFHEFMRDLHLSLGQMSGREDPLKLIARRLAKTCRVLCFDEFFVSDIADAMLLGRLLQALFTLNVVLVATSNCEPAQLYANGLQRQRFLPAIAAIEQHCQIMHLDGQIDYRLRELTSAPCYWVYDAQEMTLANKRLLNEYQLKRENDMRLMGRSVACLGTNRNTAAFSFAELCQGPRSHLDYIELCERFDTLLLLDVPPLSAPRQEQIKARGTEDGAEGSGQTGERIVSLGVNDNATRRFIALVDQCYGASVKLFVTARLPLDSLYTEGALLFEFERLKSRLVEMGSKEYQEGQLSQSTTY